MTNRISTFLVLGGGGPNGHAADRSRRIVAAAGRGGLRVHLADTAEHLVGVDTADPTVAGVHTVDPRDVEGCRALAESLDPGDGSLAVVGFRASALTAAATAARAVGSPWNAPEAVGLLRDGYACRARLRGLGFAQPDCHVFAGPAEAAAFVSGQRGRWVVKPRDAFNGEGVTVVDAENGPRAARAIASAFASSGRVVVEEFVNGQEFSAEGVFVDGVPQVLGITEKSTTPPPYFVELGHVQPPVHPGVDEARVAGSVCSAVRQLGLTHSLFHVGFWATDRGIVLGEVHARGGGDWIHALVGHRRPGLDVFEAVLRDVAGLPVVIPEADPRRAAAVAALTTPLTGTVAAVHGAAEARELPDTLAVDVLAEPGTVVAGGPVDAFSRLGLVVAAGPDPRRARANAAALLRTVTFELVPDGSVP
ncbi:ATP-grasp domain-containing protein [Kitasatospora viridis]|uniref:Biotin carboxylase n=1 Tax=Kitasatospora viridis TaxID=281105 RepID=A0A561SDJ0_9ACTN|nr:ATP-grasp domain-containing protein [Kitasatospora viridis]TWF72936.1 biotin carboxylase [Kitasatospora viridis]